MGATYSIPAEVGQARRSGITSQPHDLGIVSPTAELSGRGVSLAPLLLCPGSGGVPPAGARSGPGGQGRGGRALARDRRSGDYTWWRRDARPVCPPEQSVNVPPMGRRGTEAAEGKAVVRAARAEQRKREIAARAVTLLRTRDYFGFSVDDLCAELKINKTTFYRYFPSKEQLLFDLHQWTMDEIEAMANRVLSGQGSAVEKLRALIRGQVALQQKPGTGSLTIPQLYVFSRPHRRIVLARRDAYEATFRALIDQGIEEGLIRPSDSKIQTLLLLSMLNSLQNWYRLGGQLPPEPLADQIAETFFPNWSAGMQIRSPALSNKASLPG